MVAIKLTRGGSIFNTNPAILDPYYADMDEGESFWTEGPEIDMHLPFKDWPKPAPQGTPKVMTRWRYTDEVQNGRRGFRIRKLKYNET